MLKEIKKSTMVEDCFDGSRVYVYEFHDGWTKNEILKLDKLGELEYFHEFARPFFRVIGQNGMQLKGVEGEDNCRVIFPKKDQARIKEEVEKLFSGE